MTPEEWRELGLIALILISMIVVAWRGGARNPVGTGGLDKRLTMIGAKVDEIEDRVEVIESKAATKGDIARLEEVLARHAAEMQSIGKTVTSLPAQVDANRKQIEKVASVLPDIEARQRAMSDKVGEIMTSGAKTEAGVDHVKDQVDRLYDILIEKGVGK